LLILFIFSLTNSWGRSWARRPPRAGNTKQKRVSAIDRDSQVLETIWVKWSLLLLGQYYKWNKGVMKNGLISPSFSSFIWIRTCSEVTYTEHKLWSYWVLWEALRKEKC
jgi:hypothetical protein